VIMRVLHNLQISVAGNNNDADDTSFVVEVDDEMDEDTMTVLLEPPIPAGFSLCNTEVK
jgi:hypothetical protein